MVWYTNRTNASWANVIAQNTRPPPTGVILADKQFWEKHSDLTESDRLVSAINSVDTHPETSTDDKEVNNEEVERKVQLLIADLIRKGLEFARSIRRHLIADDPHVERALKI
ncbi:hypothetical protein TNCV_1219661 [Trichonephila clavipes]|nr:hypothetical protein TNCV_1219661 [Trichonephila clavipes]